MAEPTKEQEKESTNPENQSGKVEKRDAPRMTFLFRCLLVVVLVLSMTFFLTYLMRTNQLRQETENLNEEISKVEDDVDELRYLIDSPVDDAYIIRVAREKLGLVFPEEEVFYNDFTPKN